MSDPEIYVPETPSEIVLASIEQTLRDFDWSTLPLPASVGTPTVRQARRNFGSPDQYPCITIRWTEDAPREADQNNGYITPDEMYVDMRAVLEIEADALDPDIDPTGYRVHSTLAFHALRALKDPDGDLARWVSTVSDKGRTEDPDATNDEARFDQAIGVLYRVATENPSVILARGMNA